jgi:hypothetical protein
VQPVSAMWTIGVGGELVGGLICWVRVSFILFKLRIVVQTSSPPFQEVFGPGGATPGVGGAPLLTLGGGGTQICLSLYGRWILALPPSMLPAVASCRWLGLEVVQVALVCCGLVPNPWLQQ